MPKGYAIARMDVTDRERCALSTADTPAPPARHGGRFIVRGRGSEAKERHARARNLIIGLPGLDAACAFHDAPDYRVILPHARAGAAREPVLVEGVED